VQTIVSSKKCLVAASLAAMCFLTIPSIAQLAPAPATGAAPRQEVPPAPYSGYRPQSKGADGVQLSKPFDEDLHSMQDAVAQLPAKPPATPKQPRKVLVLGKALGYVHSSIPLAAETVKEMGDKTGAYSTTFTLDPADINTANLAQYDAIVLDSTTGTFLDDPNDAAATEARRKALLEFVRGGKGLVGIHAAIDSYHSNGPRGANPPQQPHGLWPEYNHMMNGFFKFHWVYPQKITVKIDDPKSPLTAMFHGQEFTIHEEIYTMLQDSYSRKNAHILTSIDYAKMSDEDKAKEPAATKRTDGDYGISWIRKEGQGRVFISVLGHSEHVYSMVPVLEQYLAGIQYATGDLKADDSPSVK
jgi:uncharacterized protein